MSENVKINLKGLEKFARRLNAQTLRQSSGPINDMFHQWGKRYLTFIRRRYNRFSRGGWKPLAASTKKRRRKARRGAKGNRTFAILKDTGVLFNALTIGAPGNLYTRIKEGMRVGFGGPQRHPKKPAASRKTTKRKKTKRTSTPPTIAQIAGYHNKGGKHLPRRAILVRPDEKTQRGMKSDLRRAVLKLGKQCEVH